MVNTTMYELRQRNFVELRDAVVQAWPRLTVMPRSGRVTPID